jgi:multidrug efflux system membrane fusion protein
MTEADPPGGKITPAATPAGPPMAAPDSPPRGSRLLRIVIGIGAILALFVGWEIFTAFVAYTDDAFVRSDLVALAPQVTGHIVQVAVQDNQAVRQGDVLLRIDPAPFQFALAASQAKLREATANAQAGQDSISQLQDELDGADAQLTDAQTQLQRSLALGRAGYASSETLDNATAAQRSAAATVAGAEAALAIARSRLAAAQAAVAAAQADTANAGWQLARTVIRAPVDGTINNMNIQIGDTAQAGTPLIGIVAAHDWRIIANYKQNYLPDLKPGQTAWVWLDAHPWRFYRGRIRSIGRGIARDQIDTGLLPYIAPTTDWIRLQHRFPVTIELVNPPADLTFYMGADARCIIFP